MGRLVGLAIICGEELWGLEGVPLCAQIALVDIDVDHGSLLVLLLAHAGAGGVAVAAAVLVQLLVLLLVRVGALADVVACDDDVVDGLANGLKGYGGYGVPVCRRRCRRSEEKQSKVR